MLLRATATTAIYTLSLHDALPILQGLLSQQPSPLMEVAVEPTRGAAVVSTPPFTSDKAGRDETSRNEAWGASSRGDRKSTRLNSSHQIISYAVFCLKKKNNSLQAP